MKKRNFYDEIIRKPLDFYNIYTKFLGINYIILIQKFFY